MSHGSRGKWLTGFAFLAFVASPELVAQYAKAPDTYSVTEVNNMFMAGMTMEVTRDGTRAVVDQSYPPREGSPKGYHTRTFYDIPAGKSYTQDLLQPGGPCTGANFSGDWGDPFAMTAQINAEAAKKPLKDLGPGTVNGMAAKVMEVPVEGMPTPAKVWIEGKHGLVLKLDMAMPGKPQATLFEVKTVSFGKPPAGAVAQPASCVAAGPPPPTEAEKIAAATGGNATDFAIAPIAPATPSRNSCTVLLRTVRAGSMEPMTTGFQVAVDLTVDLDHPASYKMGAGPGGKATFAGGGLKDLTSQLRNGVLRIDNVPEKFDVETASSRHWWRSIRPLLEPPAPDRLRRHVQRQISRRRVARGSMLPSSNIRSATWCRISGYSTETHFVLKGQCAHCQAPKCVLPFALFCQFRYFVLPIIPASPRVCDLLR